MSALGVVRLLVVEDHPVYRDGIAAAFTGVTDVVLVRAVGTLTAATDVLLQEQVDVVLLDLGLPDGNGLDLLRSGVAAGCAVVVLTMNEDRLVVLDAVRAGARGYLLKGAGRHELVDAVRRASAGGAVFGPTAADVVISAAGTAVHAPHLALGLSEREGEVLRLVAAGLTNAAIAARLHLAPKTVRNQVSAVLGKLGVDSREQAAERARAAGL